MRPYIDRFTEFLMIYIPYNFMKFKVTVWFRSNVEILK